LKFNRREAYSFVEQLHHGLPHAFPNEVEGLGVAVSVVARQTMKREADRSPPPHPAGRVAGKFPSRKCLTVLI